MNKCCSYKGRFHENYYIDTILFTNWARKKLFIFCSIKRTCANIILIRIAFGLQHSTEIYVYLKLFKSIIVVFIKQKINKVFYRLLYLQESTIKEILTETFSPYKWQKAQVNLSANNIVAEYTNTKTPQICCRCHVALTTLTVIWCYFTIMFLTRSEKELVSSIRSKAVNY